MDNSINDIPVLILRDVVVFPGSTVYIEVGREATVAGVNTAMSADQKVFIATQMDPMVENPGVDDVFDVGTMAKIRQIVNLPGNVIRVILCGERRMKLKYLETTGLLIMTI